jgi:hypothetical protein
LCYAPYYVIPLGFPDFHQDKLLIPEKLFYSCCARFL